MEVRTSMSRTKLLTLGILALLVVSGASASTASAVFVLSTEACTGGTFINMCWAETSTSALLELTGSQAFTLAQDEGVVLLKVAATGFEIECKTFSASGDILQASPLAEDYKVAETTITFKECAVIGAFATKCDVPAEKSTVALSGAPETNAGVLNEEILLLKPTAGTMFIEFAITALAGQTCTLAGNAAVEGTQECLWIEPLVDMSTHLLHCEPAESHLTALGQAVTFEGLGTVTLTSLGDLWDIEETT
jgi:hypothetical protein